MKSTDVIEIYHADYFLNAVDGCHEFPEFDGKFISLFNRYQRNVELLDLRKEHKLLEIGSGRGEVCIFHALRGGFAKGVDYSADAVKLAREKAASLNVTIEFVESSFSQLRESPETYDRILASEFIEHISKEEGIAFFKATYAMLKPEGKMLVYTYPNTLERRYGYPLQRVWQLLHGRRLPKIQEDCLSEHMQRYHLNEQNFFSLKRFASQTGCKKFFVGYDYVAHQNVSNFKRLIRFFISRTPLRHILCNGLYLILEK